MSNANEAAKEAIRCSVLLRCGIYSATAEADEIISALAYACTFKNPRNFSGNVMTAEKWQELACTITFGEIIEVERCLEKTKPDKPLFFILAVLTRIYARRAPKDKATYKTPQNFDERSYTDEEINSCIMTIDQLKNIDL